MESQIITLEINVENKIKQHEKSIQILEGIKFFYKLIINTQEHLNGFSGTFHWLRVKYLHKIDIYERCIKRLSERYVKSCNNLSD